MMSNNFGEILKNIRKERGLTATKLSKMLGISQSNLCKIETGKTKKIDYDMVSRICQVLDVDANQIFGIVPKFSSDIQNKDEKIERIEVEELKSTLEYVRNQFLKLALQDKRIYEIIDVITSFEVKLVNGKIWGRFENSILAGGFFNGNDMIYGLFLMSFFCDFNYKCKKIAERIQKQKDEVTIDTLLMHMGIIIRNQATRNILPYAGFQTEKFYEEFKNLINEAVKALGHKYDEIGNLTDAYIPKEAEELKHIRAIYETISFEGETIKYYDYIAKVYKVVNIYKTVEVQYMVMNLYAQAYTESVLWLKKEDPSGQWCPATPWQIIVKLKIMIPEYFLYWGKKKSF